MWAYLVPVKLKATVETQAGDKPDTTPQRPALLQVGEEQTDPAKDEEA